MYGGNSLLSGRAQNPSFSRSDVSSTYVVVAARSGAPFAQRRKEWGENPLCTHIKSEKNGWEKRRGQLAKIFLISVDEKREGGRQAGKGILQQSSSSPRACYELLDLVRGEKEEKESFFFGEKSRKECRRKLQFPGWGFATRYTEFDQPKKVPSIRDISAE